MHKEATYLNDFFCHLLNDEGYDGDGDDSADVKEISSHSHPFLGFQIVPGDQYLPSVLYLPEKTRGMEKVRNKKQSL